MSGNDMDDMLEQDKQKTKRFVRNWQNSDSTLPRPNPEKAFEQLCWGLSMAFLLGMVGSIFWVGPDRPISGSAWLGIGIGGFLLFAGLALLIRFVRSAFADADRAMSHRFERGR